MVGNPEASQAVSIKSFTCPACGGAVSIFAPGLTITAVCSACGAHCEDDNGDFKLVQKAQSALRLQPLIRLGTKGKLRGSIYQVIGYMRRHETLYIGDPWDEYLLYNPYLGYCWLSEYKGHWTQYKVTKSSPKKLEVKKFSFLGDTYQIYHIADAIVEYVVGEFYWRVKVGDSVKTMDAICPPHILSLEEDSNEETWSIGEYLEPEEVKAAFQLASLPERDGVAPNQPTAGAPAWEMWAVFFFAFLLILAFQIFGKAFKPERPLGGQNVAVSPAGVTDVEVLHFTTASDSTHITLNVNTSVNQSWTTVTLRVVPEDPTNLNSVTLEKDISYYYGVDGGESWSEGNPNAEFLVNTLPHGAYKVLLSATVEPGKAAAVAVSVVEAPRVWSNFWLALFLMILPPFWRGMRSNSFERHRWENSEYNPFERANRVTILGGE